MPLEPALATLLAELPPTVLPSDLPAARAARLAEAEVLVPTIVEPGPEVRSKTRVSIDLDGGVIAADVYQPYGDGPHPVHLFLHGGGWVFGSIDEPNVEAACRERCIGSGCVVVAVDYRKAPEHRYPAALNDCRAALDWVAAHADELSARPELITVGGQSAGANLAAALTLQVRDTGGPGIAFQLLEVPALDLTLSSPSHDEFAVGYTLGRDELEWYRGLYLTDQSQVHDPYVSPLLAEDLTNLPPALVMGAEYDPLRDDAIRYAERLQQAGVPATSTVLEGHIHASSAATLVFESARVWRTQVLEALARAHQTS